MFGCLALVAGLYYVITGLSIVASGLGTSAGSITVFGVTFNGISRALLGGLALLIGSMVSTVGWGTLKGMSWAWSASLALLPAGTVIRFLEGGSPIYAAPYAVGAFVVGYYLTRKNIASYFGRKTKDITSNLAGPR